MAFDSNTRTKLARMIAQARQLLVEEFTQQLQEIYGIQPDGTITEVEKLTHLDDQQASTARFLRERIEHLVSGMTTEKKPVVAAIDRTIREQAFTILNRFAALRMCEERGFVEECVREGMQSKGFEVYETVAGAGLGDIYERYKSFLFCLFDEIAVDLGLLFDRFSPYGLLFPREQALLELLTIINNGDLREIWAEDETIGWVYQYFNSKEEREAMRKASAAPRNSRELAVRNQFFTPRYIVEFLTDNTLGRIWYEMRQGDTRLKAECCYLVRRPNEIFLKLGESAPEDRDIDEDLTQEELLRQPAYIPHRPKKDPRDFKILDPACGSGHFLLYCFDLLETIYEEAYEDPDLTQRLKKVYPTIEDLRKDLPGIILRYNLHSIDIDRRAVQIAALALWLRAQRSYKQLGLKPTERPRIAKTNIVCAEPMPGEAEMLREFTAGLKPRVLGQIVEVIFEKMKQAGEVGSLLKIKEEIQEAIIHSKLEYQKELKRQQDEVGYLPGMAPPHEPTLFDFLDLNDEEFWYQAEERIVEALREYSERAENGHGNQRRLFAEDTVRGFAFIDLCRKRYDMVLMNPPFGEKSSRSKGYIKAIYPTTHKNIAASFVERAIGLLEDRGYYGAILDMATSVRSTYRDYREQVLYGRSQLTNYAHLGWGVLDANVETCCLSAYRCLSKDNTDIVTCFDITAWDDKGDTLLSSVYSANRAMPNQSLFIARQSEFIRFPNAVPNFTLPEGIRRIFTYFNPLNPFFADVKTGLSSGDNLRFYKLSWEVPSYKVGKQEGWLYLTNGGEFAPFYRPWQEVIDWRNDGDRIRHHSGAYIRNEKKYLKPGLTYGKRGKYLSIQAHNEQRVFTNEGQAIFPNKINNCEYLLAVINSRLLRSLINEYCGQHKENGYVSLLPIVNADNEVNAKLQEYSRRALQILREGLRWTIEHAESVGIKLFGPNSTRFPSLGKWISLLDYELHSMANELDKIDRGINEIVFSIYGVNAAAREYINKRTADMPNLGSVLAPNDKFNKRKCHELVDYILGCLFGRWDIRFSIEPKLLPELRDAFAPLPEFPPGMLKMVDSLTASDPQNGYPIKLVSEGVLSMDANNLGEFSGRFLEVLELLFNDVELVERELSEMLGFSTLEEYLFHSSGFFDAHLRLYSKSQRRAPIYWPLSSSSGLYTLWVYYHGLTDQMLYTCVNDYVNPKLDDIFKDIERLQADIAEGGTAQKRQKLEELMDFEQELKDFRDELLRVAQLPYRPNLNDGVMITAAPLWKLFRHNQWGKDLEACWKKLESGDYDWAHLAYSIWPDRVKDKCKTDLSIAIAHGLEDVYEGEVATPNKGRKKAKG